MRQGRRDIRRDCTPSLLFHRRPWQSPGPQTPAQSPAGTTARSPSSMASGCHFLSSKMSVMIAVSLVVDGGERCFLPVDRCVVRSTGGSIAAWFGVVGLGLAIAVAGEAGNGD